MQGHGKSHDERGKTAEAKKNDCTKEKAKSREEIYVYLKKPCHHAAYRRRWFWMNILYFWDYPDPDDDSSEECSAVESSERCWSRLRAPWNWTLVVRADKSLLWRPGNIDSRSVNVGRSENVCKWIYRVWLRMICGSSRWTPHSKSTINNIHCSFS